mmetsp:Transcript_15282/g.49898  ORF Transcript_15282/g.49898 Transcript_15282/m.49898 type:complete len:218 (+) Transcript_15282:443-1096(+)
MAATTLRPAASAAAPTRARWSGRCTPSWARPAPSPPSASGSNSAARPARRSCGRDSMRGRAGWTRWSRPSRRSSSRRTAQRPKPFQPTRLTPTPTPRRPPPVPPRRPPRPRLPPWRVCSALGRSRPHLWAACAATAKASSTRSPSFWRARAGSPTRAACGSTWQSARTTPSSPVKPSACAGSTCTDTPFAPAASSPAGFPPTRCLPTSARSRQSLST